MTDYLAAYAAYADTLDREPECRCAETDRGTDTLGCPSHDPNWPESEPDEALAMAAYSIEATREHDR